MGAPGAGAPPAAAWLGGPGRDRLGRDRDSVRASGAQRGGARPALGGGRAAGAGGDRRPRAAVPPPDGQGLDARPERRGRARGRPGWAGDGRGVPGRLRGSAAAGRSGARWRRAGRGPSPAAGSRAGAAADAREPGGRRPGGGPGGPLHFRRAFGAARQRTRPLGRLRRHRHRGDGHPAHLHAPGGQRHGRRHAAEAGGRREARGRTGGGAPERGRSLHGDPGGAEQAAGGDHGELPGGHPAPGRHLEGGSVGRRSFPVRPGPRAAGVRGRGPGAFRHRCGRLGRPCERRPERGPRPPRGRALRAHRPRLAAPGGGLRYHAPALAAAGRSPRCDRLARRPDPDGAQPAVVCLRRRHRRTAGGRRHPQFAGHPAPGPAAGLARSLDAGPGSRRGSPARRPGRLRRPRRPDAQHARATRERRPGGRSGWAVPSCAARRWR